MTAGFGEVLRERALECVRDEVGAFFGAFEEAASAAIYANDFDGLSRSTDQFAEALRGAIPAWVGGETVAKEAPERTSATAQSPTGSGQKERTAVTSEATFTKGDVRGTADALAKQKIEAEPQRFAKMSPDAALASARREVWGENPDLVRLHESAEPEAPKAAGPGYVEKAVAESPAFAELEKAAQELRKVRPDLRDDPTGSIARTEAAKLNPGLRDAYYAEQRAGR